MIRAATIQIRPTGAAAALAVLLIGASFWLANLPTPLTQHKPILSPEKRAVAFLDVEVPRWHRENHCYSCHNNGDGARALLQARRDGYAVGLDSLLDTQKWLDRPGQWDHNGGEGGFSDKVLARIQFARALADVSARAPSATAEAARTLAQDQQPDGHWPIDDGGAGSPCTYGNMLATAQACQALRMLAPQLEAAAIHRGEAWLGKQPRSCTLDHVAVLFGRGAGSAELARDATQALLSTQSSDGGWGLYARSGSEPFDTAVGVLALAAQPSSPQITESLARGRRFLIAAQQPDGGWIETTRPPGGVSYAQRISTTSWATLALLATHNRQTGR